MQYIIIKVMNDKDKLEKEVNMKLQEGWKCQGGVAIRDTLYCQAMIKE